MFVTNKTLRTVESQLTQFMSIITARLDNIECRLDDIETALESAVDVENEIQRHVDDMDFSDFLSEETLTETIHDILVGVLESARISL